MGSRNLDRVPLTARRRHGDTVGQMRVNGWKIRTHCDACRVAVNLSLDPIIALRGPLYSLWDRRMKCPVATCAARAWLAAKAPGMAVYQLLVSEPERPPEPPAWLAARGIILDPD